MAFLDENGLAELWRLIGEKNVKLSVGSYTGNGNYGASKQNSLTFPFTPKLLFISSTTNNVYANGWIMCSGNGAYHASNGTKIIVTSTSGNTVSWYASGSAQEQLNIANTVYNYVAIS